MMLFKSFDELVQNQTRIENVLIDYDKYHAHTHREHDYEKLHEHVHLVMDYATKLVGAHGLDDVLDSMIQDLIKVNTKIKQVKTVGNFVKRLFVNALVYHDYGKVNENFQIDKMHDKVFFKRNETNGIGSQHSILSAYIFLNTHLKEITEKKGISGAEANFLIVSTYLFANSILKHHSSFLEHQIQFEEEKIMAFEPYLKLFKDKITKHSQYLMLKIPDVIKDTINKWNVESKDYFPFYALLKLNFSLLTASDYYATNHFMGDMPMDDFGLIDNEYRVQLFENFIHNENADYNCKLYREFEYYSGLTFESLEERNNMNLNLLRQKMATEAITELRKNIQQKLFYLEAPTGGGKTNMSFACALELLKTDARLNKVFYVFPFTTLITQTFESIKKTLQIDNDKVIELHSKAGFHKKREEKEDGLYGNDRLNYINNTFINYPFTLLSHIRFFNIIKGNSKDNNYILHRLSNSIVIIDELQTYSPDHWDKIIFFLHHYAKHFNIRFVIMSATLPKIDQLSQEAEGKITYLIPNKQKYFTNANFKGRVEFDFSMLGEKGNKTIDLEVLADKVLKELEMYASNNEGQANGLIEFIIKKSASAFFSYIDKHEKFKEYQKFLISGTILEPRRQEIIEAIKTKEYKGKPFEKSIVVTTQVVEAGVDIDMDLGFKDTSLVDSDEQLAGRINRNAKKNGCKVFLFNYDRQIKIYGKDKRFEQRLDFNTYKKILEDKNFDLLYNSVNEDINKQNKSEYIVNLSDYLKYFRQFDFRKINEEFKLIDSDTTSVFVPVTFDVKWFSDSEKVFLHSLDLVHDEEISGVDVLDLYEKILERKDGFIQKAINKKQIGGIMSKFMFSVFTNSKLKNELLQYADLENNLYEKTGIICLLNYGEIYSIEGGINDAKFDDIDNQFL